MIVLVSGMPPLLATSIARLRGQRIADHILAAGTDLCQEILISVAECFPSVLAIRMERSGVTVRTRYSPAGSHWTAHGGPPFLTTFPNRE